MSARQASRHAALARPLLITFGSLLRPDGGTQVRSRVIAEALTELGASPAIISTWERSEPTAWHRERVMSALRSPRRRPRWGFSVELSRLIARMARGADSIIIANAMFIPAVILSRSRLCVVWDANECQTLHYSRMPRTWRNVIALAAWWCLERWAARRCTLAVAISEPEAAAWRRLHPTVTSKLITIDHSVMSVERDADESRRFLEAVLERSLTGPVILFVGTLRAKHNLAAARWLVDVLAPQLDADVTLVLCGPGTESLHVPPGTAAPVACLGFVDDIDAIITATDLCLAPLASGGGVHTKVLHYLSHGKRVLGTPVAFEGIVAAPGVTRAPLAQFASRIRCVLAEPESPEQAAARSQLQRSWLEQHHGHAHIVQQLRDTMAGLAPSGQ